MLMGTDGFIFYTKTEDIYSDIAKDVETGFDTSNYELDRPLPKIKINTLIGLMKNESGEKIMKELPTLRGKHIAV